MIDQQGINNDVKYRRKKKKKHIEDFENLWVFSESSQLDSRNIPFIDSSKAIIVHNRTIL